MPAKSLTVLCCAIHHANMDRLQIFRFLMGEWQYEDHSGIAFRHPAGLHSRAELY